MNQTDEIEQLKAQLKAANEKIAELTAIIKLQQNQLFGKKLKPSLKLHLVNNHYLTMTI